MELGEKIMLSYVNIAKGIQLDILWLPVYHLSRVFIMILGFHSDID